MSRAALAERDARSARMFVVRLLLFLLVLEWAYYWPFPAGNIRDAAIDATLRGYAHAVSFVLRMLGTENASVSNTVVGEEVIRVTRECDAFQCKAAFLAATLAYPTSWRRRLWILLIGLAGLTALNLLRIVTLYYVKLSWPSMFELMHYQIGQWLLIAATILLFVICVKDVRSQRTAAVDPS
ncbi:MAG: exosortase/archaeosortase family protein [Phycisphaerae bacterium]|nr:exosortase/archaeosortase family protein [Phycisphaerae bacterium]